MSNFLQLIALVAIILVAAKFAGYLSTRFGQPSVFGELLMGVLLGPSLLNLTHMTFVTDTHLPEIIAEMGELGVLLLMFLAGLELHFKDLTKNTRVAALAGIFGVVLPVGLGILFGELTGLDFNHSVFLGLTLGATSVSISAQVLIELKVIRSRVGLGLLGAAIFDDVLVILLLSSFVAFLSGGSSTVGILLIFGKMLLFFGLSVAIGLWVLPKLVRFIHKLSISQGVTTLAIVVLLVYGLAAELVGGMAAITGAFISGLMFARTPEKSLIETNLHSISYAFFVPIFFISIGLSVDLHSIDLNALWTILAISIIAVAGKVIGSGSGALLSKFSFRESMQIGIGMISRGEVGLIIAKIGLDSSFLSKELFSSIIAMILITTVITPPLLRAAFSEKPKKPDQPPVSDSILSKENA
ncbi:MAG: putative sodium/hydrogen antiporter [Chloroflexi bacterium]|nr:MAG: putative sodium/hydrogen antiporter [Chloroflexota bacterium]